MKITIYLNEESLQGQLCDSVYKAINNLLAVINALASNRGVEVSVVTSSAIFSKQVCAGTGLTMAQLSKVDRDLFMAFKGMLDKGKYWDKKSPVQHPDSRYMFKKQSVNGTSVAEARESVDTDMDTMLVSIPSTNYTGKTLAIEKDGIKKMYQM